MTRIPSSEDKFADALAHQLNNPTATILAAASSMRHNLRALLEQMTGREAGESTRLARFLARTLDDPVSAPVTGLMPQDRLQLISRRLASAGVKGDLQAAASCLARGGWDTYMEEIAPLLGENTSRGLELLETAARLRSNLAATEASAERIRGLAAALRLLAGSPCETMADVEASLRWAVTHARASLPAGVEVELSLEPMPPVRGRENLLREAWANFLANAVQAVGERGRIRVEGSAAREGAGPFHAVVRIVDDGPGIPAEAQSRLFEPFFTTRSAEGGTGLGLALARRIVEASGGRVSFDSRPGRTCFEAVIPAMMAAAASRS
ncbi:MAG: ATP-binding protein [Candidatus Polarisedimenticolia bacterium]